MSYNRKQIDRKKRHSAPKEKVRNLETESRGAEKQKLKMSKWDV